MAPLMYNEYQDSFLDYCVSMETERPYMWRVSDMPWPRGASGTKPTTLHVWAACNTVKWLLTLLHVHIYTVCLIGRGLNKYEVGRPINQVYPLSDIYH